MANKAVNTANPAKNRHNITMDETTRERAEILAEKDKRSVSNLLEVLVDREWVRLNGAVQPQEKAA